MLSAFQSRSETEVISVNEEHPEAAVTAFLWFGRGPHPAVLNLGDCLSYAVASVARLPLLFTGNDFALTGIPAA
jgi:ribonuclease VapC